MKKICILICMILLMVSRSFAQSPRQPTSSEGKTGFVNVAVRGLNVTGVPGYIEITSTDGDVRYLFIDDNDKLRIASDIAVGRAASPQTTTWVTHPVEGGKIGIVVGDQVNDR